MTKVDHTATTSPTEARKEARHPAGDVSDRRLPLPQFHTAHAARECTVERIRPAEAITVAFLQPLPNHTSARLTGSLLSEVRIDGELHHYRIAQDTFVLLCPPAWLARDSFDAVRRVGLTVPGKAVTA